MKYKFKAKIQLKDGIIDPEVKTITKVMQRRGYKISNLKFLKEAIFEIDADSKEEALKIANHIVDDSLANPILEKYNITLLKE